MSSPIAARAPPRACMTPADLDPALIASARFLHASGISQAISASCRGNGRGRHRHGRAGRRARLLRHQFPPPPVDGGKGPPGHRGRRRRRPTFSRPRSRMPQALLRPRPTRRRSRRHFLALGARAVVVTLGRDGVFAGHGATGSSTCAGPAGRGGRCHRGGRCLHRRAARANWRAARTLAEAARFANAAAALSTLGYGAIAPLPARAPPSTAALRDRAPIDLDQGPRTVRALEIGAMLSGTRPRHVRSPP